MIFKSNLKERIKKPNCSLKEISENYEPEFVDEISNDDEE